MAECQAPYPYSPTVLMELEANFSSRRFGAYLQRAGHKHEYAIQLYLYNARLAKSLLFPLHILEIVLRNGIDQAFSKTFGLDWHLDQKFRDLLSIESNNSLQKAISRFNKIPSKDDVISELSLDFWSNIFRSEYDRSIWQTNIGILFPQNSFTRASLQPEIVRINKLRNRIAHHEPILDLNNSDIHAKILNIIEARSIGTSKWVKAHSTFTQMVRTKPNPNQILGPLLKDQADSDFAVVDDSDPLLTLHNKSTRFFISKNDQGNFTSIFTHNEISCYIMANLESGMIDLGDHSIKELINSMNLSRHFSSASEMESVKILPNFFKKHISYAGVTSVTAPNTIVGVIAKSHRRY